MGAPYDKGDYRPLVSFGFEQVTVDSTAGGVPLTATKYDVASTGAVPSNGPAKHAYLTVETAQFRYTTDGTAPTTTVGHLAEIGDVLEVWGTDDIKAFRAIRTGATSASIAVTYGR